MTNTKGRVVRAAEVRVVLACPVGHERPISLYWPAVRDAPRNRVKTVWCDECSGWFTIRMEEFRLAFNTEA